MSKMEEGLYVRQPAKCRFCQKDIVLQIHEEYAAVGDRFKLLPMACCNDCADLRNERRKLEGTIKLVCISFWRANKKASLQADVRKQLESLTLKYANLVARWHNMSGQLWEEEFVNMLMDKPEEWWTILAEYWKGFRRSQNIAA